MKKAFDTLYHKILIDKYGIKGNIFNWFKSYLSNRKQYIHWQGRKSEKLWVPHSIVASLNYELGKLIIVKHGTHLK